MKHDKKKIEELWKKNALMIGTTKKMLYFNFEKVVKQYAEHMVKQERERIVSRLHSFKNDFIARNEHEDFTETSDTVYLKDETLYDIQSIINLINKEDENKNTIL